MTHEEFVRKINEPYDEEERQLSKYFWDSIEKHLGADPVTRFLCCPTLATPDVGVHMVGGE